jgi:molybdate transport system regulatory protein
MQAQANFWIEKEGEVVLSSWRVSLLEAVEETGSITAAAAKMNISYRRAWEKIHESEESHLTPEAADYVKRFREFTAGLNGIVAQRFEKFFPEEQSK